MRTMDVMTAPAECCSPEDSLERVAQLMWDFELRAVPVVDCGRRPIGWVSDRAICMTALRTSEPLKRLDVRSAMIASPPVVHRDVPVSRLEREMSRNGNSWLVVIDDAGAVAGIVTSGDIDRALRAVGNRALAALRSGVA